MEKLSFVIPTRERAEYLQASLQSAFVAADLAQVPVEIVVSDNASTDATQQVLAATSDPRLVVQRSERRLSMRENFEFALSRTTGSHIIFIGDDDAVLPNGLRVLAQVIRQHDPDIVKWRVPSYLWSDPATGAPSLLRVRPHLLTGRVKTLDPQTVLDEFAQANARTYQKGGMIYHGCVSRRLIEAAVSASDGPYFRGSSPDVFTSLRALMVSDRPMIHLALPITLGGASPRSNGAAVKKNANSGGALQGTEYASFITESADDPWQCRLPSSCQSLEMVTLDCLQSAAKLHRPDLKINLEKWSQRIAKEIAGFAEPARSTCLAQAKDVLGLSLQLSETAQTPTLTETKKTAQAHSDRSGPTRLRHSLSRLAYKGGEQINDSAAAAAAFLDTLACMDREDGAHSSRLTSLMNFARMHLGAARMLR